MAGRGQVTYADLVRRLMENYLTFAHDESLMGITAEGQGLLAQQVQEASDRVRQSRAR